MDRRPRGGVDLILRLESAAVCALGIGIYVAFDGNPWFLLPLLLLPDVSMLGYLRGPRLGALTYNLVHNWVLAVALIVVAIWLDLRVTMLAGAIVLAHVGMDRTLGYGLKLPTGFTDTHLGRIGRRDR